MENVEKIIQQLVNISSYPRRSTKKEEKNLIPVKGIVEEKELEYPSIGEEGVAKFIKEFFKKHCPFLTYYERQEVYGERYNLIVGNCKPEEAKLIFCCHMDTVFPKDGQAPKEEGGKIYGLGSVDMKGGIAALLSVLSGLEHVKKGLQLVFYCNEEADFLGMKKLIAEKKFKGALAIFCEPTNLKIVNGCRGLIEFDAYVKGRTAHGSRPDDGINAITVAANAFQSLRKKLENYSHEEMGPSVCNMGGILGGLGSRAEKEMFEHNIKFSGNSVADIAFVRIEARAAIPKLDAKELIRLYEESVKGFGGYLEVLKVTHDYGQLFSDKNILSLVEEALKNAGNKVYYEEFGGVGYYDSAMFFNKYGIPCISLGPGPHEKSHKKDEYVEISSLYKIRDIYKLIICYYGLIDK